MEYHIYDPSRRHAYEQMLICQTMQASYGTGGGNVPIVVIDMTRTYNAERGCDYEIVHCLFEEKHDRTYSRQSAQYSVC